MRSSLVLVALVACKSESKVVAPPPVPIVADARVADSPAPDATVAMAPPSNGRMGPVYRGVVKQLSVGTDHACVITSNDTIACWSDRDPTFQLGEVPEGTFRSVHVGTWSTCAHRTDGEVVCFEGGHTRERRRPAGSVEELCHDNVPCVRRADGKATCFADDGELSLGVIRPESLACGASYSAALAIDGTIRSVMIDKVMALGNENATGTDWDPPKTPVERVFAGYQHGCAIHTDHTVTCWGRDVSGETKAPAGELTTLALGEKLSCGLRPEGSIECWGSNAGGPWAGPFLALGVTTHRDANNSICAIRADHTVACWNYEDKP